MKTFLSRTLLIVTIFSIAVYLLSCLTPWISPVSFWPMAFAALLFPYLFVGVLLLLVIWLFVRPKVALIVLLFLLPGLKNLSTTFAFNGHKTVTLTNTKDQIRVLTWNVRNFDNPSFYSDSFNSVRRQMFRYLAKTNADVLCLQEFSEHIGPSMFSNTRDLQNLGYKYVYTTRDQEKLYGYGKVINGIAIFSKLPIIDSGKTLLGDPGYPEYIAFADVMLNHQPIRIFTSHFKSINLFASKTDTVTKISFYGDERIIFTASKPAKLKMFAQAHVSEAGIIKQQLKRSPYPLIFTVDMNSVPTSYPYYFTGAGLQDAFIKKGFGLGTTLDSLPITLRIDYLFLDQKFHIDNYKKDILHLSDHFPQYIDVSLPRSN